MNVVVDSSAWIEWLRGHDVPDLEAVLRDGLALVPPIVVAELVSGCRSRGDRERIEDLIRDARLVATPLDHWVRVGALRGALIKKGVTLSIPDAHVAQCALDGDAALLSLDKVFAKIAKPAGLRLVGPLARTRKS